MHSVSPYLLALVDDQIGLLGIVPSSQRRCRLMTRPHGIQRFRLIGLNPCCSLPDSLDKQAKASLKHSLPGSLDKQTKSLKHPPNNRQPTRTSVVTKTQERRKDADDSELSYQMIAL